VTFDPNTGAVSGSYLLVHDQVGSVVRTVDLATGVAVEVVAYDPWGVATVSPGGTAVHLFGFAGGLWDRRTGLVRFGAREYDAGLGRWLARDPIGFAGGWNQYGYVANNPVGHADPTGLANYEHPMQWLPPDADIRAGALLGEQEIAESLRDGVLGAMLWEFGGAFWARPCYQAGAACSGAVKGGGTGFRGSRGFELKDPPDSPFATWRRRLAEGASRVMRSTRCITGGIKPSVVDNTIRTGTTFPTKPGTIGHFDQVNNIRAVTNAENGTVVTVIRGAP
jgi:RHS repeat-associated protein